MNMLNDQLDRALGPLPEDVPEPPKIEEVEILSDRLEGDERPLFEASYRAEGTKATQDLLAVVTARGAQYGSPDDDKANLRGAAQFGVDPIVGALIRANDKWIRLRNLLRKRDPETGDVIIEDRAHYLQARDQMLDIAGYQIKAMEMLDELAEQEGWL